jgi:hypothetical protein
MSEGLTVDWPLLWGLTVALLTGVAIGMGIENVARRSEMSHRTGDCYISATGDEEWCRVHRSRWPLDELACDVWRSRRQAVYRRRTVAASPSSRSTANATDPE